MPENPFRRLLRGSPGVAHYVFAAVFLLRLIALARLTDSSAFLPSGGDAHFYDEWAKRIVAGQWTDHQAFYGLPLYAYAIASLYKLFGYSPFVPGILQAAVDAGTATLLFKLGQRVFGQPRTRGYAIGITAAAAWAIFVPAQAYSVILMPTAWLVFAVWFLVWQIIGRDHAPGPGAAFLCGLLLGVTATAVAAILFLLPLLVAALIIRPASMAANGVRQRAAAAALLILGVGAGTAPCWLHNTLVAHDRVFLSAHSGVNFWIGNNPEATGYPHFPVGLSAGQATMLEDSVRVAEENAGRHLKRSEVSEFWSDKARTYIRGHPAEWLRLMAKKYANAWNAFEYDDLGVIARLRGEGVVLPGLRFGFIAALAIGGIFLSVAGVPASRWILAATLLQMAATLPVFVTERYRLAAVPGLILFAAAGAFDCGAAVAKFDLRRAASYLALLAASALFVTVPRGDFGLWALEPYNSGRLALEAQDLPAAKEMLERAYAYAPQNPEVNFALGNLRLASGSRADAQASYLRTLELDARHKGATSNLGVLALESGDARTAAAYFRAAAQLEPTNAKTHFLLAKSSLALHDYDSALLEAERAIALDHGKPEFLALPDEIRNAARAQ